MFERQWFSNDAGIGMRPETILFESKLRKKDIVGSQTLLEEETASIRTEAELIYWKRQRDRLDILNKRKKGSNKIDIRFEGFWNGFDCRNNEIGMVRQALQTTR